MFLFTLLTISVKKSCTFLDCIQLLLINLFWDFWTYLLSFEMNTGLKVARRSTQDFNIPPHPGKARAFELLKIGSFEFPPPRAKKKCSNVLPYRRICLSNAFLKNNRRRLLSSFIKLVHKHANTCLVTHMMMPFTKTQL